MANVTLMGASYTDVPAVTLPKTGGGTVTFYESGGGGATQHVINLTFSDSTDTDINVYYDNSLIGTMITAYQPTTWTYNNKVVYVAQLDNVTWYDVTPSPATWETVYEDTNIDVSPNGDGTGYMYITDLRNVTIADGSEWRITIGDHADVATARYYSQISRYGIPHYNSNNVNDAICYNNGSAWIIYLLLQDSGKLDLKVERQTT